MPFEQRAWEKAMVTEQRPDTCMTVQFSHIMAGGYAAGYYSYKWAKCSTQTLQRVQEERDIRQATAQA
jgi:peptidyl-dipeptidase Dcp